MVCERGVCRLSGITGEVLGYTQEKDGALEP